MNDSIFTAAEGLVSANYVRQAREARRARESLFKSLLSQRRLPDTGWDDGTVQLLLQELAGMDSNTFVGNAGVGEREARVICPLVSARHFGLGHGIGRSGDIAEEQPKAAGSSLLYKLTNALCADAIKRAGASDVRECLVLPVATGMTVTLTLLALRKMRPEAKYVVWPRIDQKSCLKAVSAAGCKPLVVENVFEGDELRTDVAGVAARIAEVGAANVLCVLTTTSCFAPRGVDKLLDVARLCAEHGVPHIANNAYGIQCKLCMKAINAASRHGRLDAYIQSTDKNFLVPVGGAVIASSSAAHGKALIAGVSATYPGRASVAPILDLFMTLLHLGASGWERLLQQREALLPSFRARLAAVAHAHGERVLSTPHNSISHAVTLSSGGGGRPFTAMGAQLWVRLISGARIIAPTTKIKEVAGIAFPNYGASCDAYPVAYFTAACALGATEAEADLFFKKLDKTLKEWKKMKPLGPPKEPSGPPKEPSAAAVDAVEAAATLAPVDVSSSGDADANNPPTSASAKAASTAVAATHSAATAASATAAVVTPAAAPAGAPPSSDTFRVTAEGVAYKRYLQVQDREVTYPDGRVCKFDIVGHPRCEYVFVVVFVYHTASQGVTLLREFAQAAPPHGSSVLTLPTGGYDRKKHASLLDAAKAELSEEARLCGGTWHRLLPEGHPGVLEAKWCRNRFTPFLCVDPAVDAAPGTRDAEEHIEILSEWPVGKVIDAMAGGELLLPSLQTCVNALAWLRNAGLLPSGT